MEKLKEWKPVLTAATIYLLTGALWIFFSDKLVEVLFPPEKWQTIQTYKGWIFIFFSSLLIFILTKRDFSNIQKAHNQLSKLYQYQISFFNDFPELLWRFDVNNSLCYLSNGWENFTGYKKTDLFGEGWLKYVHPDDLFGIQSVINEAVKDRKRISIQYRIKIKNSEYKWIKSSGKPYVDFNGVYAGYTGISIDLTNEVINQNKYINISRLYALLSKTNQAIVNNNDEKQLFTSICEIGYRYGGFKITWIGVLNGKQFKAVSINGENSAIYNQLDVINLEADANKLLFNTLLKGEIYVCNKSETCIFNNEILKNLSSIGVESFAAIPIIKNSVLFGLLMIFTKESRFFDENEVELLQEVAVSLKFAVEKIENEKNRLIAENNLKLSEIKFRELVENMTEVFLLNTYDTQQHVYVSPSFEKLFELPVDVMYNNPKEVLKHVCPEYRSEIEEKFTDLRKAGNYQATFKIKTPSGVVKWIKAKSTIIKEENNIPYRIATIITDITETKLAELKILQSRDLLSEAQRLGQIGSWEWEIATDKVQVSNELYFIFGVLPDEFSPRIASIYNAIYSTDRAAFIFKINTAIDTKESFSINVRVLKKNGEIKYLLCKGRPIEGESGKTEKMLGFVQDISDKVLADKKIHDTLSSSEAILKNSPLIIFDLDKDKKVKTIWNETAERVYGYTADEMLGNKFSLVPMEDYEIFESFFNDVLSGQKYVDFETAFVNAEKQKIYLKITALPLVDRNNNIDRIIVFAEDTKRTKTLL